MKNTHSMDLTSVPVAMRSTVTAMRGLKSLRNRLSSSSEDAPVDLEVILTQKSLPLPNTSRTWRTMSSAWLSSLAKISVLGTTVRPGKMPPSSAGLNSWSRKRVMTVRIWSTEGPGGPRRA
jgi:hypothetical protein